MRKLTVGSLFSGIGGIDLGLERAGMEIRWHSEIDPYASRVLAKHWPGVPNYGDATTNDYNRIERVDVLAGGFACQDVSGAGNMEGLDGETRSGITWREYVRALRALRPGYALMENVAALLSGHGGRWFGTVLRDLAESGYDAEWDCIPASAVGAPHRRDRVFIVAYPLGQHGGARREGRSAPGATREPFSIRALQDAHVAHTERERSAVGAAGGRGESPVSDEQRELAGRSGGRGIIEPRATGSGQDVADPERGRLQSRVLRHTGTPAVFPPSLCGSSRGRDIGRTWDVEPDVGRLAHGLSRRLVEDGLRGLGNAVVPQIPELIGGWIIEHARAMEAAA